MAVRLDIPAYDPRLFGEDDQEGYAIYVQSLTRQALEANNEVEVFYPSGESALVRVGQYGVIENVED